MLSGAHLEIAALVVDLLRDRGADDIKVVEGGDVHVRDHARLLSIGVAGIFPTGSSLDDVIAWFRRESGIEAGAAADG